MTIRDGRRCSAAVAYLRPALARANLAIEVDALASRVLFEGRRAVGIEYLRKAARASSREPSARSSSAGGVINSPQLLMLSGIGDPGAAAARTASRWSRRSRASAAICRTICRSRSAMRARSRGRSTPRCAPTASCVELAKAYFCGHGIANDLPGGVMAFLKSGPDAVLPDIQLLFNAAPLAAEPYFAPFVAPFADGFACRAALLRPESRGELTSASADPRAAPRIRQNFLATEKDWEVLRRGVRMVREIGRQKALTPFAAAEISPGPDCRSDAEIDAHIRATGDHRSSPARHLQDGAGRAIPRRWSIPSSRCWASTGCGSSTPR